LERGDEHRDQDAGPEGELYERVAGPAAESSEF